MISPILSSSSASVETFYTIAYALLLLEQASTSKDLVKSKSKLEAQVKALETKNREILDKNAALLKALNPRKGNVGKEKFGSRSVSVLKDVDLNVIQIQVEELKDLKVRQGQKIKTLSEENFSLRNELQKASFDTEKLQIENDRLLQELQDQKVEAIDRANMMSFQSHTDEKGNLENALKLLQEEYMQLSEELKDISSQNLKLLTLIHQQSQALEICEIDFPKPSPLFILPPSPAIKAPSNSKLISKISEALIEKFNGNPILAQTLQTLNSSDQTDKMRIISTISDLIESQKIQSTIYPEKVFIDQVERYGLYLSSALTLMDQILSSRGIQSWALDTQPDKKEIKRKLGSVVEQLDAFMRENSLPFPTEAVALYEVSGTLSRILDGLSVLRDPIADEAFAVIRLLGQSNELLRSFSAQIQSQLSFLQLQARAPEDSESVHELREEKELLQANIRCAKKCLRGATSLEDQNVVRRAISILNSEEELELDSRNVNTQENDSMNPDQNEYLDELLNLKKKIKVSNRSCLKFLGH